MLSIKRGDTAPALTLVLGSSDLGFDLTDAASIRILIQHEASGTLVVDAPPSTTDTATGTVTYNWQPGDTARLGTHKIEVEVTWTSGAIQTFPSQGCVRLDVIRDLG